MNTIANFTLRAAIAVTVPALLLTACSSASSSTSTSSTTSTPAAATATGTPSPTATSPAVVSAKVGDCYDLKAVSGFVNAEPTVPCEAGKYNEKTIAVLDLPADLPVTYPAAEAMRLKIAALPKGAEVPADWKSAVDAMGEALKPVYDECDEKVADATGEQTVMGAPRVSRLTKDVTGPTQEQWDAGERWARCNVALTLEADKNRPATTLQPLPAKLASAANAYKYQVCYTGEDSSLVVLRCDSNAYKKNGAWLVLTSGLPLSSLGTYPGSTKAAWSKVNAACKDYARGFIKRGITLKSNNYYSTVFSPKGESVKDMNAKTMWNTPGLLIRCRIPNWAYGSPS